MFTREELKDYVETHPKQVRRMTFSDYPDLFILKYKHEVFWEGSWNKFLQECRGLVVDKDYNPIIRPFTKVFNLDERGARYADDRLVYAEKKINGFMAAATYVPMYDEVVVSTTGSLDSPFTKMARETLEKTQALEEIKHDESLHNYTFMFEIVHPDDPHIIKDEPGAWLLSSRSTMNWDAPSRSMLPHRLDLLAEQFICKRPNWFKMDFGKVVGTSRRARHEGWIVFPVDTPYTDPGLKIKTPYYLSTKWFARMKPEKIRKLLTNVDALKREVDEEFFGIIDRIASDPESFYNLDEQGRITYVEQYFGK